MKIFYTILSLFVLLGCSKKNYTLELIEEKKYGDEKNNIISYIMDFECVNDRVYIFDQPSNKILVFGMNGELLKTIKFNSGSGPGELRSSATCMAVNESYIAIADEFTQKILLFDIEGNFIRNIDVNLRPGQLSFYKNNLYVVTYNGTSSISVYDINGEKIQELLDVYKDPTNRYTIPPTIIFDLDDESIFALNPFKAEIRKIAKENGWIQNYDGSNLIDIPKVEGRGILQLKTWASACKYQDYLIATNYDISTKIKADRMPSIILVDSKNGNLLYRKKSENIIRIKSFENSKYTFIAYTDPYPYLALVKVQIK